MPRIAPWIPLLMALPLWIGLADTAAAELDGSLQNPGFADCHPDNQLPPDAIDTDTLPSIVIQTDAADAAPLPYYRLAPDTYFLYGNIAQVNERNRGFNGNAGFVVTADGVVVIDSLGTPELGRRLIATIRSVTDRPIRYLILTHSHPDHAYGAVAVRELDNVTVIGHPGILDYLASPVIDESAGYRRDILGSDMRGFKGVEPDVYIDQPRLDKPHVLELGNRRFAIYNAGKHHSSGDLVVHQSGADILWISDLAFNQRTTFMGDGDSKQAIEGQNWLLENFAADARLMVPGHGSAQTAPFPMVAKTRDYIQRLRDEMAAAIDNGLTLSEAVEQSRFPDWADVPLYEANHRRNANFVYLEMEMALF